MHRTISAPRLLVALAVVIALVLGSQTSSAFADTQYGSLIQAQAANVEQAIAAYTPHHGGGVFVSADYHTGNWEKEQIAAVAFAVGGAIPSPYLTASQAATAIQDQQVAEQTVDNAISTHQLPSGEFDNGTPALGNSGVSGTFWAVAEGEIAILLEPYVSSAELASWQASMEAYANYTWNTQLNPATHVDWYANGNVVLRQTLVLLETYRLTGIQQYQTEYNAARAFLTNPGSIDPNWSADGWRTGLNGSGWFTESPLTRPNNPIVCNNGMNPCNGFDPNYTAAQLNDAILAYELDPSWLPTVEAEAAAVEPLITPSTSMINASNGSRDNIPSELFYTPVWAVLDFPDNAMANDAAWSGQEAEMTSAYATWGNMPDAGPLPYADASYTALGLIDALHLLAG